MSFEEQIMSKNKCLNIFSFQMEAIVFIIRQIFFATSAILKTEECHADIPQFQLGGYSIMRRILTNRARVNIFNRSY